MEIKNKFWLLLKTSRPIFWIVQPLIFLISLLVSGASLSTISFIQLVFLSFPYCIFLYGINDVYDYESDKLNPRKKLVEGIVLKPKYHHFIKKTAYLLIIVLIIISLLTFNLTNIMGMVLLLFFSYFYSAPPLRLKVWPPLDSFANGMLYIYAPALLGFSFGGTIFEFPIKAYFVIACGIGFHAMTTIPDYTADKKVGDKTFAIVFGKRSAAVFAIVIFLITLFFSGIKNLAANYYLLACIIVALVLLIKPIEKLSLYLLKTLFAGFVLLGIIFLISGLL